MAYVDFFCLAIRPENLEAYTKEADLFAIVMKDHGMQKYCETIADDVPRGTVTDFYRAVAAVEGETVIAAYLVWPDKATRDKGWAEGMKDPRLKHENTLFDGKRMFWGGFKPIVER